MADSLEGLEELEGLRRAVHRLGRMDPGVLGHDELHALVIELQKERARLGAAAAELLSRWDARRLWAGDGSRSAAARLSRETSTSLASAAVEMRRARQLRSMPTCAAAIADGSLALDHVDLLGRANQPHRAACFARDERFLVDQVSRVRFAQAAKIVEYWSRRADAATGHDDGEEPAAGAELQVSCTWDGTVAINGMLDPVGGAIVADELGRLEHGLSQADQRDGVTRTAKQRRAAALVIMAQRSATTPAEGRRPRPLFTVLLGHDTFADLCELANGIVITPRHLVPWLGTAELETILFDGPSTVVSVSRRRSFTGAVRRARRGPGPTLPAPDRMRCAGRPVRCRPHRPVLERRLDEPVQRQARVRRPQPSPRSSRSRRGPASQPADRPTRRAARPPALALPPRGAPLARATVARLRRQPLARPPPATHPSERSTCSSSPSATASPRSTAAGPLERHRGGRRTG